MSDLENGPTTPAWTQHLNQSQRYEDVRYTPPRPRSAKRLLLIVGGTILLIAAAIALSVLLLSGPPLAKKITTAGYSISFPPRASHVISWTNKEGFTGRISVNSPSFLLATITYPSYKVSRGSVFPGPGVSSSEVSRYLLDQALTSKQSTLMQSVAATISPEQVTSTSVRGLAAVVVTGHLTAAGRESTDWSASGTAQITLVSYGSNILGFIVVNNQDNLYQRFISSFHPHDPGNLANRFSTPASQVDNVVRLGNSSALPTLTISAPPRQSLGVTEWLVTNQKNLEAINASTLSVSAQQQLLDTASKAASPNTMPFYEANLSSACVALHTSMGQILRGGLMPTAGKQAQLSAIMSNMVVGSQNCVSYLNAGSVSKAISDSQTIGVASSQMSHFLRSVGMSWVT